MLLFVPAVSAQTTPAATEEKIPSEEEVTSRKAVSLDPYVLKESRDHGYGATNSLGGSRIDLPLLDVPMTLVVVNRTFMDDVGATDFLSALSYVSGMNAASDVHNGGMALRGLEVRGDSFNIVDGLPTGGGDTMQETEFVERYEVVKGPAGTLYGDHSIGGLVNRIMKRPLKQQQTSVELAVNSYGHVQTNLDVTGPIDKSGQFGYRLVGVYGQGDEQLGGPDNKKSVYGILQYQPKDSRTTFWVRGSREARDYSFENGNVLIDKNGETSMPYLGKSHTLAQFTNDNDLVYTNGEFGVTTSGLMGFLGDWTFRAVARYTGVDRNWHDGHFRPEMYPFEYTFFNASGAAVGTIGGAGDATFRGSGWTDIKITDSVAYILPSTFEQRGFFLDLTGRFVTGPADHRMLIYGQETFNKGRTIYAQYLLTAPYGGSKSGGNLNLANAYSLVNPKPIPSSAFADALFPDPSPSASDGTATGDRFNFGVQDNIYFMHERLLFSGGARYDNVYAVNTNNLTKVTTPQETSNWVYKAAGVVKPFPNPGIAIFLNYSETFTPQYGVLNAGTQYETPVKNLAGSAKEVGLKFNIGSKFFATGSYFQNELANYTTFFFDPVLRKNIAAQGGTATIKGWEVDTTWAINENWNILLSGGDYDSRQANDLYNRNVPIGFNYKALARYSFTNSSLKGLSIGAGMINVPKRAGDYASSFFIDGYNTYDAFITYHRDRWRIQLNVFNLTDKDAIVSSLGALYYNYALERRHALLSVKYQF